ncbi:MAG TPA: histidinol-phosphate transaminase [Alphaproteobacteria bacterium]|nr:histidinol-phosphate transaminase [Micavibrio sp.]HPQ50901.1 histidinol-phosphate transaminase [Alphaproteobacteria bacterium]HRK97429.1 histidinol-phosphate transaminase [Alphaproteobacteria bacterium]
MSVQNPIILRARQSIRDLKAYSSARSIYKNGDGYIFLDANECSYEPYIGAKGLNRYAGQQPEDAINSLCRLYDVSSKNLILTRGADEAIDILVRAFCEAGQDSIVVCPPTFPMYVQAALVQGAEIISVPLKKDHEFSLDIDEIQAKILPNTKIVFLCSPNNPTGNVIPVSEIEKICEVCDGHALVVVDETYIEYSNAQSCVDLISRFYNLVVLRTLSKAYAAAGLRAGVAIADMDVIGLLKKVLAPYPVAQCVAQDISRILVPDNVQRLDAKRANTMERRAQIAQRLENLDRVEKVYPSDANFLLLKVDDAKGFYQKCLAGGVIVRDQSHLSGLENCVRITIGSEDEMNRLFNVLEGKEFVFSQNQRIGRVVRKTSETAIDVQINLDRASPVSVSTGIGFYDHMLEQIAKHGGFSLQLECAGDLEIDPHHSVEDCAIALGAAIKQALADKRGIGRYGFTVPMDESLCEVALDLSGRFYLSFDGQFPDQTVGGLPCDMVEHIFRSLAENIGCNLHIKVRGENSHHMVEACFKAFGRALGMAIRKQDKDDLPSTKGVL